MMTAIGSRFRTQLDVEVRRMINEWFFKWHHIGRDRPVEIDSFDGRKICYAGSPFSGTARVVFWDTIQRYLRQKISALFDVLESDIVTYPPDIQRQSIGEVELLISGFASRIRELAIQKDRILRGNGTEFPDRVDSGNWEHADNAEVHNRAEFLKRLVEAKTPPVSGEEPSPLTVSSRLNAWYHRHQAEVWILGFFLGIFGIAVAILGQ
jgi:hypothetical protein